MAFGIGMFLAVYFYVGDVAGRAVGDEDHHLAVTGDGFAFGGHSGYLKPFKQG